jgi:predicted component of type VI protein secretion system
MDAHRTTSVSRVYVPNQYTVWLGAEDRERLEGYERSLEQELSAYLLEHARRHDYALLTRPEVKLESDDRLRLGEFGIQTRLVKPAQRQGEAPQQGEQGHTMVYSVPPKQQKPPRGPQKRTAHLTETKAIVSLDDRRYVLDGPVAVIGRSRECDCVLADPNVSRRHAELKRNSSGDWSIADLGSTNGIKVNGRQVDSARLTPGDQVQMGTTYFTFDIEA